MNYKIEDIQGIGPAYAEKLAAARITTTNDLLTRCADRTGRDTVSEATGVSTSLLLTWSNMADLMRISGIGPQFAELLEAAGVDTVKELRTRNITNLTDKMKEVNDDKKLSRVAPSQGMVDGWVKQAKRVNPTITH